MRKQYLTRSQSRVWAAELPVGDPTGGAAYKEKNDPATITMASFSSFASIAGTAMSVIGAISQGQQAKSAAQYNADVANNNAIASRQQAEANAASQSRKARMQIGSMRAGYGASGVDIEGSPLDMLEQSASMAELDRQNILYGGELRAGNYQSTAGLDLMRGDAAETGSYFSAASSALMGAAKSGAFNSTGVEETTAYPRGNNPDEFNDWELRRTY